MTQWLTGTWPGVLILSWVLLTLLFSALGTNVTESFDPILTLVFWAVHVGLALAIAEAIQVAVSRLPRIADRSPWEVTALAGGLAAVCFLPFALLLDRVFPDTDPEPVAGPFPALLSELLSVGPPVVLVWLALNATRLISLTPANDAADQDKPDFWRKVPVRLGSDLVALSAELHYTRVTTTLGDVLILYSFGEAIRSLPQDLGLQVHRSHWIALDHVTDIRRRGSGAEVTLCDRYNFPVSRRFRAPLQDALEARKGGHAIRA